MRTRKCTRYICDHCSRGFWRRPQAERHEPGCFKNPGRQPVEGEIYPVPRRPIVTENGNLQWRHRVQRTGDGWIDGCIWPRLVWGEDHPDLVLGGWEPEDPETPHVFHSGRWWRTTWESWDLLFEARSTGEVEDREELLLVEEYPGAESWWVGLKATDYSPSDPERSEDDYFGNIPF